MIAVNSRIEASDPHINVMLNCKIGDLEIHIFTLNWENEAPDLYIFTLNLEMGTPESHIFTLNLKKGTPDLYTFSLNTWKCGPMSHIFLR